MEVSTSTTTASFTPINARINSQDRKDIQP
jgi:hypothetical protein